MQSPFPGMDPYLEKYWHEVHKRLIIYAGDQLQERLPRRLRAKFEERVLLESESDAVCAYLPRRLCRRTSASGGGRERPARFSGQEKPLRINASEREANGRIH